MNKTYSHSCGNCHKTYFAYDPNRIFCCETCELLYERKGRGNYTDSNAKFCKKPAKSKEKVETKPKEPKKKIDLKNIMYRDTFKKFIPRSLMVMRG